MVDVLTGSWSSSDFVYMTRKQANVVYAAYKRGDVEMTKRQVKEMYRMVGDPYAEYWHYAEACSHICNGRYDMAQAELDGKNTTQVYVVTSVERVMVTEDNELDFLFYEIGDYAEVEHGEWVWKVME